MSADKQSLKEAIQAIRQDPGPHPEHFESIVQDLAALHGRNVMMFEILALVIRAKHAIGKPL